MSKPCCPTCGRFLLKPKKPRKKQVISAEYRAWQNIKHRCDNPKNPYYSYYGGRGIKMCEHWRNYKTFYADMGKRPSPLHSLDRINNDGDYEPSNCRWATKTEQNRNRGIQKNNTSGVIGVSWDRDGWTAYIKVDGERIYLGRRFRTFEEAVAARKAGEMKYWGVNINA